MSTAAGSETEIIGHRVGEVTPTTPWSRRSLVVGESERTPQPSRALWHQVIGKAGELDASDPMLGDSLSLLRPGDTGR